MVEQIFQKRGRHEGRVNGNKDRVTSRGGGESGADAAKRALARRSVWNDRRERSEFSLRACDGSRESCFAEDGQCVNDQRLAGEFHKRFIDSHAAGLASGKNKARRIFVATGGLMGASGWTQAPTTSRNRMMEVIPISKFFRLNFSLGA